jgi:hypothetical protein
MTRRRFSTPVLDWHLPRHLPNCVLRDDAWGNVRDAARHEWVYEEQPCLPCTRQDPGEPGSIEEEEIHICSSRLGRIKMYEAEEPHPEDPQAGASSTAWVKVT